MAKKNKRIDAYILKSADFAKPILTRLRELVHKACPEVEETIKWGMPSFDYKGPFCSMASFKEHAVFGFWKGSLLKDPKKHLQPRSIDGGSAMGHFGKLTSLKDLPPDSAIMNFIKQHKKLNDEGIKLPPKPKAEKKELVVPAYFTNALKKNKKAQATFNAFSYSNRKDYVEWVTQAKTDATRDKRMETAIEWMAEGKGRTGSIKKNEVCLARHWLSGKTFSQYKRDAMGENPDQSLRESEALQKAAETIQKSEFKLRMLFNSAHDAIFTMDNKTFVDCNEATLRIFQCTRNQIVGQTPFRFSPPFQPDGRTSEEAAMEKIMAALSGTPQSFAWKHIRYDGTPFDAEVSLNRLDLKDEVQIQAIVRDVSERKKTEEENRMLAMVANIATNLVTITDADDNIQWVNPSFERVTGYSLAEVLGKKPANFLRGPESNVEVIAFIKDKVASGEGFKDVEILNHTKDGRPYWVSIEVQPIHDKSGKVTQFVSIQSDISERKANQQALLDRNEELSKLNAELDRFVYSASHDLRAPISSLLGLIEVVRMEKNMDNIDSLLDMQKRSLNRLDHFIKDIVDHSRNTRLLVEADQINFEKVIQNSFEHLQFMENAEMIKKEISVELKAPFFSSPSRLEIILNNLISNAMKYANLKKDDPFIEVRVKATHEKAEIRVIDNGEGIPVEAQPKIFDMFYRGSARGMGSGLGLYIVKEALQKINGSITVVSEFGKGTEFVVEIPNMNHDGHAHH